MKKLFLGITVMSFFVLASCEKEIQSVNQDSINSIDNVEKAMGSRFYFDNGKIPGVDGVDYGCSPSAGNCLPEVVVTGYTIANVLDDLNNEDPTYYKYFFQDWGRELVEVFESEDVENVGDGTHTLVIRDAGGNKFYYLIMHGTTVVSAYPIII
jgi:hypothetical protein